MIGDKVKPVQISSLTVTSSRWMPSLKPFCWCWHISFCHFCGKNKIIFSDTRFYFQANLISTYNFDMHLLIFDLFLHPSPPSQWLVRVPLVIMLPQVTHGFPLAYGCRIKTTRGRLDIFLYQMSFIPINAMVFHLFFGTEATEHPRGELHGVVLIFIVAHIAGVSPAAARKPGNKRLNYSQNIHSKQNL